jgi:hypothetical protein
MKNINDYIVVLENVMTYALCDAILEEFSSEEEWQKTVVGSGDVNKTLEPQKQCGNFIPSCYRKKSKGKTKVRQVCFCICWIGNYKVQRKFSAL